MSLFAALAFAVATSAPTTTLALAVPSAAPAVAEANKNDAAVIVGISAYDALPAIPGAADTATEWFSFLTTTRGVPGERVHLLRDGQATREEIEAAVAAATAQVKAGGTLWFLFVGHGAPDVSGGDGLLLRDERDGARPVAHRHRHSPAAWQAEAHPRRA